jgi:HEAT repeat protein
VIADILGSVEHRQAVEAAPKILDDVQQLAATVLQAQRNNPALLDDGEVEVRLAAMLDCGQAIEPLIKLLDEPDIRWVILLALGRFEAAEVVDRMVGALDDENPLVRMMATRSWVASKKVEEGAAH